MKRHNAGVGALARAVIAKTWRDFRKRDKRLDFADIYYARQEALARAEAVDFLTQDVGEWAEAREAWAKLARVPADKLREKALSQLEDKLDIEAAREGLYHLQGRPIFTGSKRSFGRTR